MTAFVALLTLDMKRTERNRVDCLPCVSVEGSDSETIETDANIANGLYTEPGLLGRFMQNVYAPFIANPGVQAVVLALFLGMFFTSIVSSPLLAYDICLSMNAPIFE
jgi:Niemann-Pick C1 protein